MNNEQNDTKYLLDPFEVEYNPVTELIVDKEQTFTIEDIKKSMVSSGYAEDKDFVRVVFVTDEMKKEILESLKAAKEEYSLSNFSAEEIVFQFDYQNKFENMVDRIRKVFSENRKITHQTIRQETSNLDVILMAYFTEQEQNVN